MNTENTNKICPIMLLVGTISETGDAKVALCIKDMCAWWVESETLPPNEWGEIHYSKPRCGIAR